MDPAAILLRTSVFAPRTAEAVSELLPELRTRRFDRGRAVWVEGDPARSLHVLVEGQVKSHRVGRDGGQVILGFNDAIDLFGEVGLFHPSGRRRVSVTTMTPVRCLTVPRAPLVRFLARHPVAMERMLERLSTIAGQAAYSFSGLAFDDIRRRVASALLTLADEFGERTEPADVRIRLCLSQAVLAALVAASRENVNRALGTLVAAGVVSQRDGHFHVHDLDALRQAATVPNL
jgi:CRP-like cAMP-binding protein